MKKMPGSNKLWEWKAESPKNDDGYFEQMTRALFQAGLNWRVIENKWPTFQKAFAGFSIERVAKFDEKDVERLMKDEGVVRNEKKIRAAITNAKGYLRLREQSGSFRHYLDSFGGDHERLLADLQSRFRHLGESSARTFLWMVGVKLKPTSQERLWHRRHLKRENR